MSKRNNPESVVQEIRYFVSPNECGGSARHVHCHRLHYFSKTGGDSRGLEGTRGDNPWHCNSLIPKR